MEGAFLGQCQWKPEDQKATQGRTLHREFVGMLFALAIAEVAVRSGAVVHAELAMWVKAPALTHLGLAAAVIAASWVGWGWSESGLSNVRNVFTKDFVELCIDVWLVVIYFFIVQGSETVTSNTIVPSLQVETKWVMIMFITYVGWDLLTKFRLSNLTKLKERGWASASCALLGTITFLLLRASTGHGQVIVGDLALLMLVFLFRAMKLHDLSKHSARTTSLMTGLFVAWLAFTTVAYTGRGLNF